MSYGRGYDGGDLYSGPGVLESLVGSFLDTRSGINADKRKRMLEDQALADKKAEQAKRDALAASTDTRANDQAAREKIAFNVGLDKEGLHPSTGVPQTGTPGASVHQADASGISFDIPRYQAVAGTDLVRDRVDNPDTRARQKQMDLGRLTGIALDPRLTPEQRQEAIANLAKVDPTAATGIAEKTAAKPQKQEHYTGPDGREYVFDPSTGGSTAAQGVGMKPATDGKGEIKQLDDGSLVRVIGNRYVPITDASGNSAKGRVPGNNPGSDERAAAGLLSQATAASQTLDKLDTPGQANRGLHQATGISVGDNAQRYFDAAASLAMAYTYAVSGKQMNKEEAKAIAAQIVPRLGEGDAVTAQKKAKRAQWLSTIQQMAGRAAPAVGAPGAMTQPGGGLKPLTGDPSVDFK